LPLADTPLVFWQWNEVKFGGSTGNSTEEKAMHRSERLWATVLITAWAVSAYGQTTALPNAFTDVTGNSGIEQILDDHCAAHPEW
jgi:hypothetical protein